MINKYINEIKDIILSNLQRIVPQITDVEITINKNFSGTSTEAAICHQICPKTVLCILRNEIIKKLK